MTVITASKSITSNVVQRSRRTILSVVNLKSVINARCRLTKKAEPPPTGDVNRDSGTESANGGWLRRLVRRHKSSIARKLIDCFYQWQICSNQCRQCHQYQCAHRGGKQANPRRQPLRLAEPNPETIDRCHDWQDNQHRPKRDAKRGESWQCFAMSGARRQRENAVGEPTGDAEDR